MFQPICDRVLIKPDVPPDTTESGLRMVQYYRPENCGEVVAVPVRVACECPECGSRVFRVPDVKIGDVVVFSPRAGQETTIDGVKYLTMREDEIVGVLEGEPA